MLCKTICFSLYFVVMQRYINENKFSRLLSTFTIFIEYRMRLGNI